MVDWLVVGAGFSGAVLAERIASQLNQTVVVVDKRSHIGGNAYDFYDDAGVLVHRYGPHLFHTNSSRVRNYLSQFTAWRHYEHRVRALVGDVRVPVPFNLTSLRMLFPSKRSDTLEAALIARYGINSHVPILRMREECQDELRELADFIYQAIFFGYTQKQWGLRPDELSPSVTGRVPIRISHDSRYFQDSFQAMPADGYTAMFERMLSHRNIRTELGVDWREIAPASRFRKIVYTGPIDSYFENMHGPLPYRSLRFEWETINQPRAQEVGQINYPGMDVPYTRAMEFKHATGQQIGATTISREIPQAHVAGVNEPFYPIPRDEHRLIFDRYKSEAKKLAGQVVFCGRLADYQYYNMDQVVARALLVFEQEVAGDAENLRRTGDTQSRSAAA